MGKQIRQNKIMSPKEYLTENHPNFLNSRFHLADYYTVIEMLEQYTYFHT